VEGKGRRRGRRRQPEAAPWSRALAAWWCRRDAAHAAAVIGVPARAGVVDLGLAARPSVLSCRAGACAARACPHPVGNPPAGARRRAARCAIGAPRVARRALGRELGRELGQVACRALWLCACCFCWRWWRPRRARRPCRSTPTRSVTGVSGGPASRRARRGMPCFASRNSIYATVCPGALPPDARAAVHAVLCLAQQALRGPAQAAINVVSREDLQQVEEKARNAGMRSQVRAAPPSVGRAR